MDSLDPRDTALQALTPTVMVPRFGALTPLAESGHRFLMANDGVWLEVRRPWLHLIHPLASQRVVAMPYGALAPVMQMSFGKLPLELVREFVRMAQEACPNETAAWIVWNEEDGCFDLRSMSNISAGRAHANFDRPVLDDHEHVVVDIHSHGMLHAFFSAEDNFDDLRGEVKLCVVVGNCEGDDVSIQTRLCANGLRINLPSPVL